MLSPFRLQSAEERTHSLTTNQRVVQMYRKMGESLSRKDVFLKSKEYRKEMRIDTRNVVLYSPDSQYVLM